MKISQTLQKACQVLRRRVRFTDAGLYLGSIKRTNDTEVIRRATYLYTETWIVPILDAIERGDTAALKMHTESERGQPIARAEPRAEPMAEPTPNTVLRLHLECTSPGESVDGVVAYLRATADLIERGTKDQTIQGMGFYGNWKLTG